MIFVTVGTQLPFDRMIKLVDQWAIMQSQQDIFAQIGKTALVPQNLQYTNFINPLKFRNKYQQADFIISHAGMGSILSALEYHKPILIFPRRADLNEHRNDHQMATAKHFQQIESIFVAFTEEDFLDKLSNMNLLINSFNKNFNYKQYAEDTLLNKMKSFINS